MFPTCEEPGRATSHDVCGKIVATVIIRTTTPLDDEDGTQNQTKKWENYIRGVSRLHGICRGSTRAVMLDETIHPTLPFAFLILCYSDLIKGTQV